MYKMGFVKTNFQEHTVGFPLLLYKFFSPVTFSLLTAHWSILKHTGAHWSILPNSRLVPGDSFLPRAEWAGVKQSKEE